MKPHVPATLTTLVASLALVVVATEPAAADAACSPVEQVTSTTAGGFSANTTPVTDADGDRIAFRSNRDLTGGNADLNQEVFLADLTADTVVQITSTTGGGAGFSDPSISDDGTKVVFAASANLTGANAELASELFLYVSTGPTLSQLTDVDDQELTSDDPDISGDGTAVAFISEADLAGANADLSREVFLADITGTPSFTQLTSGVGTSSGGASVDESGSRVAFTSPTNPVPATGNADGNLELFVWDATGPTTVQLTTTTGFHDLAAPTLSEDGTRVLFRSAADLAGQNPDGNHELFRRTITSPTSVQLTDTTTGANTSATTDETGSRVAYVSSSPDLPRNADANGESAVLDVGVGGPNALSVTTGSVFTFPSYTDDGTGVAFTSNANPLGTNPDLNQEIFVSRCGPLAPSFVDVPTGNVFFGQIQWMEELGIASGFPGGLFKPQDGVKRQQMAGFMYNLAGQPAFTPPGTPTFLDVPASNPFFLQIEWMVAEGIASGFPGGLFKPQDVVKRQQMANFLYNLAGQPVFSPPVSPSFNDVPASNPFFLQIEWMLDETVASGFPGGLYKPQDPVKRQQMANFMHNFAVSPGVSLT